MKISDAMAVTHPGRKRANNEDGLLQIPEVPLYAVVDGSGGTQPAQVALDVLRRHSRALLDCVAVIRQDSASANRLALGTFWEGVFAEASERIAAVGKSEDNSELGASMVTVTVVDGVAYVAHLGNSRAYLLRRDELWQLTTDHTFAMTSLLRGDISAEEYETSPFKHRLSQGLGQSRQLDVEFAEVWLEAGDRLMLCSDGLTKVVDDQIICERMAAQSPAHAARGLIQVTLKAGAPDNVSVVVVDVQRAVPGEERTASIAETLRDVFLFRGLTEPDRLAIAPYLESVTFPAGDVICQEGEAGDAFYVVIDGEVNVTHGETFLTTIGPGGNFGELALIGTGRRTATVTAVTPTRVFQLSRARFLQVLKNKPSMATNLLMPLLVRVGGRLADVTERLAGLEAERR